MADVITIVWTRSEPSTAGAFPGSSWIVIVRGVSVRFDYLLNSSGHVGSVLQTWGGVNDEYAMHRHHYNHKRCTISRMKAREGSNLPLYGNQLDVFAIRLSIRCMQQLFIHNMQLQAYGEAGISGGGGDRRCPLSSFHQIKSVVWVFEYLSCCEQNRGIMLPKVDLYFSKPI